MAVLDEAEFARWRDSATRTRDAASALAAAGSYEWACFLAEQAAQLATKGLLHGLGEPGWGHDLTVLVASAHRLLEEAGSGTPGRPNPTPPVPDPSSALRGDTDPAEVDDAAARLSRHYIPARYPDAHPAGPPAEHYREPDARQALLDAATLLGWVDTLWGALRAADGPS